MRAHTDTPCGAAIRRCWFRARKRPETVKPNPSRQRAATYIRRTFSISILFSRLDRYFSWQREGSESAECLCDVCVCFRVIDGRGTFQTLLRRAVSCNRLASHTLSLARWLARYRSMIQFYKYENNPHTIDSVTHAPVAESVFLVVSMRVKVVESIISLLFRRFV